MVAGKKTQHSPGALAPKIAQRLACLPDPADGRRLRVLDAYGGDGDIWRKVNELRGAGDIVVTSIDKTPRQRGQLKADNLRFLASVDLSHFDVVDLDAWGVPSEQIRVVADQQYEGIVPWTCILVGFGRMPNSVLAAAGVPPHWANIAQSLVSHVASPSELWFNYLGSLGYAESLVSTVNLPGGDRYYGVTGDLSHWTRKRQNDAELLAAGIDRG